MSIQTLTLKLPDPLYRRLEERAERAQRSIEAELLDLIAAAIPVGDELPRDLGSAVSALHSLDEKALWQAARNRLPLEASARLESLHLKRQRESLTPEEDATASALVAEYERLMLVRAAAVRLLKERGCDVTMLRSSA